MRLRLALVLALLGACFNPTYNDPACGPGGACPTGFTCQLDVCVRAGTGPVDAAEADGPCRDGAPDDAPDASIDAPTDGSAAGTAAQIAAARAAPDGTGLSLPITDATITYVLPAVGATPAGFTIQATLDGPALVIAVDPATLTPAPRVGSPVSFTITAMVTAGGQRNATAITGYASPGTPASVDPLTKDVSAAADLVAALETYDSELIDLTATLTGAFAAAGAGFESAPITTTGYPTGNANLRLRVPATLRSALDLAAGCRVVVGGTPLGRVAAVAQPTAYAAAEVTVSGCPAPVLTAASAPSSTRVTLTFSRNILPASVAANGSQFTFDNGLTATAAVASGRTVTLATSAQTPGTTYTVTVASAVTDLQGTGVGTPAVATFTGGAAPAPSTLVINEVDYDQIGIDNAEFIELFNSGATARSLSGLVLVLVNGTTNTEYLRIPLGDTMLAPGGYFLIGPATLTPAPDLVAPVATNLIQNGMPDGVLLLDTATGEVVDALSYEGAIVAVTLAGAPLPVSLVEGNPATAADSDLVGGSMVRLPNGRDTNDAASDWMVAATPSPRAAN